MKVSSHSELANALQQAAPAKQQARAAAPAAQAATPQAAAARSSAAVTFSSGARALDSASRAQGDFDAAKVKAVRASIENGTFKVNAGVIADKLLANAQEVFAHVR